MYLTLFLTLMLLHPQFAAPHTIAHFLGEIRQGWEGGVRGSDLHEYISFGTAISTLTLGLNFLAPVSEALIFPRGDVAPLERE